VPRIGRPDLFQSSQSYLAFCVAMLALSAILSGICPIRGSARHARGTRQRTRGGVVGIDVFRTKVSAFALSAVLAVSPAAFRGRFCIR